MRTISAEEWIAEGIEKFGADRTAWRFVCPICGHTQSGQDFILYRKMGARPDTSYNACIGKYNGKQQDLDNPEIPGCLFSIATQPDSAAVEIEYGTGHKMRVMEFVDE